MTGAAALTLLLLALALAVQPWSVLAGVLLVASDRGVTKEVAYVIGWVVALLLVAAVTVTFYPAKPKATSTSTAVSVVELVAGVVLVGWAAVRWRRPSGSARTGQPTWMSRIDTMGPAPAGLLGAFLPNYVVVVAAVSNLLEIGLSRGAASAVLLGWVVVASLGVAAPLVVLVVRRDDAPGVYAGWRAWLLRNGQAVLLAVLAVVGVALVAKGVVGLVT